MKNPTKQTFSLFIVNNDWNREQEDVLLDGSCLISHLFMFKNIRVYMIIRLCIWRKISYLYIRKGKFKNTLLSGSSNLHKEDSSTNALYKKESKKRMFVYKNVINLQWMFKVTPR